MWPLIAAINCGRTVHSRKKFRAADLRFLFGPRPKMAAPVGHVDKHTSKHVRMENAAGKPKKARKRTSRSENETLAKKARINGSLEEALERDVARDNVDSDKNDTMNEAACNDRGDIFNGQSLRLLFSSSSVDPAMLRKFVTICNENRERDLAAEYLLAGGSVLEVLKLLNLSTDKKSTANATTVFSAVHILLMRILTECPQYRSSATEACRHLLNSYMSVVHSMLSTQSTAKQRKVVLRLLAAIVSLDSNLSRQLLVHLSLQQQTLESLVQHTKPSDSQSVRTCFIHFVLAFLVEGNTLVIRTLLDKHNLLCCIFSDLLYDSKDVVTLVLTTVKTYVLENTDISKTIKLHVFSVPVVLNLISLYNWKGPNNWLKNKTHSFDESESFLADKEVVSDIVHEFLITLLTSHRYGVVFHDRTLGSSQNIHNQLVRTVLQNLEKPWEHEKPSDLIIRIMNACPDLIRSQYGAIEPFLEPRVSSKWICLFKFIGKVVKSIDPVNCIKTCNPELKANNLTSILLSLAVPSVIVKVAILPGLDHDSLSVRHEALSLLLIMVNQLKVISLAIKELKDKTSTIQNQITDFTLKTIPTLETILRMWNQAFENDTNIKTSENAESIQTPELVDHLDIILSVLHSYQDICPELLDISTNLQPNLLLSSLNSLQDDEEVTKDKVNCMKVKTIKFLLALDSSIFAPEESTFKEALVFLISLIREKDPSLDNYNATRTLLNSTGLFEACEDQLDIWINGFSVVANPKENEQLTQWFMFILKDATKHVDKYTNYIVTQAKEVINDQIANLNVKTAEDIINELFDKTDKISPCQEESSKIGSLINGQFNFDDKKDDSFYKFNQQDPKDTIKNAKCVIQNNKQVTDFNTKEIEDMIYQLFDKTKSFLSNECHPNKISSMSISSLMNEFTNFDTKETNGMVDTFFNDSGKENSNPCRMQACTAVSPLLCCALHKLRKKKKEKNLTTTILTYLSYVTVHTLHYQVVPDLLIHMTKDLTDLPVYKYLQSWSSNKPIFLNDKLPSLRLLRKLSGVLLADSKMDLVEFSKLFDDGHSIHCFKYRDREVIIKHSLSLYDIKTLLKMTVFYLAQLAQSKILRQTQNENCKLVLAFLLNISQSVELNQENIAILEENASCIFTHPILLHYFSPFCGETSEDSVEYMITETILEVCDSVLHLYKKYDDAETCNIFFVFRDKFLAQLRSIIEKNSLEACSNNYGIAIDLLKILQLSAKDIASLLCALMKLEKVAFISNNKKNLTLFGHVVPVLLDMYCSKESRLRDMLNEQFVERLSLHLVYMKSSKIKHVGEWEQALAKYLSVFPRNVSGVSTNTFGLLLTKGITTSTIQLITTLIAENVRLIPSLVKYFLKVKNAKQGDIVFPILGSGLKYKWDKRFLQCLHERYGDDIAAHITDPQNPVPWIEENAAAIVHLIESTFDLDQCRRICDNVSKNGDKLDMVSVSFVQLLESVYKRCENLLTVEEKSLTVESLIRVLLHVMTSTLKKESKNIEKIKVLCEKLNSAVIRLKQNTKDNFVFFSLSKSYSWPQFTRFSLKLGLKDAKDEVTQSNLLKTLSNLCDTVYGDNVDDEYAKTLFEMTTSHSEFVNIILGSSAVKGDLIELLRILVRKNHSVMTASHVPLYLAAYNATLCHVDQRILQILQYYETHNVNLQRYWPYLWGSAAATCYSVKGETDTALWRQPSTTEVFNLFNKDIVNETIRNYPIHRAMKSDELHENSNVYDPAFYLPLLCTLLAENNIVACHKISQNGVLALVLAACCSDSSDIRMTAYTIISRYYFHLEASKSKEKLLWMRLIDALRNGIVSLKCPLENVRLSCLMTTFLARTSLIASQPLHPLYSPLHTFLMAKTALDLNTIPELLQLLHSSHVQHNAHRYWILENIRDGIKETNDVNVALKCMLFKILLDFHTCTVPDAKTKKLILEIIASTTRIPKASSLLIRGYGMLPWLREIVNHPDMCEMEIKTIITIIQNLLNTLDSLAKDIRHYKTLLFNIVLLLQRMHLKNRHKICSV